jgi:hypothetical protein
MTKNNFYRELDKFIGELYADGTAAKWENERLGKKAKKIIRKTSRKTKEARNTLEGMGENRSVRAA